MVLSDNAKKIGCKVLTADFYLNSFKSGNEFHNP